VLFVHGAAIDQGHAPQQGLGHDIAHQVDPAGIDALSGQVLDRIGPGREVHRGELVGDQSVHFLGHRHVERTQPSLEVDHGDPDFDRG